MEVLYMEERYIAKIGERGQMTLPTEIRKLLEASQGEYVAFDVSPKGKIELKKVEIQVKEVKKVKK
jgi:AbrB family looped-hinge helix DNA binding protein